MNSATAEPLVSASHLGKSFGHRPVLDDLSFNVERGDVIGVLGKNGAGKTTLLELMLGFSPATCGNVRVFGHDSFSMPGAAKARVGFVPQRDELLDALVAREQLRVIASFHHDWDDALIARLSAEWEVDLGQRVKNLSVGQRQKLSILIALGHHPDLLVLDEPVASLDPIARRQFLAQIVDIAAGGQRAVVFSSHIVSDLERLANKIWILKAGRLYWQGDLDSLKESVVRVHLRSSQPLPADLVIPNAVSVRREGAHTIAVACNWNPSLEDELRARTGAQVVVEDLSLEEIFLELHR